LDGGVGWLRGALGTTATGRCAVTGALNLFRLSLGRAIFKTRLRIPVLSDATTTYSQRYGFFDIVSSEATDGVFFRYTHSVNGGRFQAVSRNNNVETAVDTGVTVAAATTYRFHIDVNAAGTSVEFLIDGAVVATITTNIPTAASPRTTGFGIMALKSVGTTAVNCYEADYVMIEQRFTGR
jgi:hypothetical protein